MISLVLRYRMVFLFLLALLAAAGAVAGNGPQNVLVVANVNSKDSLEIGNAYRRARGIPYRQYLLLKTTTDYQIPYQTYLDEIETPIKTYLREKQLADAVTCIVLVRGIPQMVTVDRGRSVASLLATLNMPNRPAVPHQRLANPYFSAPDAFSHRPTALKGMYLVTTLTGYNTTDALNLVAQGAAADGSAPDGRYIFHTIPQLAQATGELKKSLEIRNLKAEVVTAPPQDRSGVAGYFSGGIYSGLNRDIVSSLSFRPGAIVDMAQNFSAAPNNLTAGATPTLLPAGWFIQAGATGLHGVVGEAGFDTMPIIAAPQQLLDKYTGGFSLAESYYSALPYLNWQNVIVGDPLCSPYLQRPVVTVETDAGTLKGIVPVRVTASSPMRGATISRVDLYVDDQFMQTIYQPDRTQISLYIGEEIVIYTVPHGATLRTLLEGLATAVNNDIMLNGPDGVHARPSLHTGSLVLTARRPGTEHNNIPIGINIQTDTPASPGIMARIEGGWLAGGGQQPSPAGATISFIGRRVKAGDEVTVQVQQEHLTFRIPDDPNFTIANLPAALAELINADTELQRADGVVAIPGEGSMPYLLLRARTAGVEGNALSYQASVKPAAGSLLRVYPDFPAQFSGGHDGSAASQIIRFMLGETTAKSRYLLNTANLSDGFHRLRVVAYDGSLAQGQGIKDIPFTVSNFANPPLVKLPEKLTPASSEITIPVTASGTVVRINLYVDGQLLASSDTAPFETVTIPLGTLGRGMHDLWAEGIDAEGRRYVTAPTPLEVLTSPEISVITPAYTGIAGGTTHRISGTGFQRDCSVQLAGVPVRSVRYINANLLEVVSDAGAAGMGLVTVTNPNGTTNTTRVNFEYYRPLVTEIHITPAREVLAPGQQVQYAARCLDQHNAPIQATVFWEPTGGTMSPSGIYTAGNKPGSYIIRASHPDSKGIWEAPVIIGSAKIVEGQLQHWLVLGPFPDPDYTALEKSQIEEAVVLPSHGQQAENYAWKSLYTDNDYVNLHAIFTPNTNAAAYAHVYIQAPAETACSLVYGSDDGIRIWLNGELVQSLRIRRNADPNQNTTRITLKAGWNRLLLKLDQGAGGWGFYMRLHGHDGKPLPDLYYSLDNPLPAN